MSLYRWIVLAVVCMTIHTIQGQDRIYNINFKQEAAYLGTGIGLQAIGFFVHQGTERANLEEISLLDRNDINAFDRSATYNYSSTAQTISDVILFSAATLPFFTYCNKHCRTQGSTVGIMAIETFLITNGITNITKSLSQRYRPYNYNENVPDAVKLGRSSKLSFFSGHASNTAAMSFFTAKVITDLHPEMKNKGLVWGVAAGVPAVISYLRYEAGKHFPTDLITGYAVGATIGYLIPSMHLSDRISIQPYSSAGMSVTVKLN